MRGPHDLVADPKFVNPQPNLRQADFRLAEGSPARNSGSDEVPQPTDLIGKARLQRPGRDRGAYEQ